MYAPDWAFTFLPCLTPRLLGLPDSVSKVDVSPQYYICPLIPTLIVTFSVPCHCLPSHLQAQSVHLVPAHACYRKLPGSVTQGSIM